MISDKDKLIFDYWSHKYLFDRNAHVSTTYENAKWFVRTSAEFVLSKNAYDSEILKELYGY